MPGVDHDLLLVFVEVSLQPESGGGQVGVLDIVSRWLVFCDGEVPEERPTLRQYAIIKFVIFRFVVA